MFKDNLKTGGCIMNNNLALDSKLKPKKKNKGKFKWIPFIFLLLGSIVMIVPFLWAISGSLAEDTRAIYNLDFFKFPLHFENYAIVFKEANFLRYVWNSIFLAAVNIIGTVFANTFIGFGMAKYDCKSSRVLFFISLCTMFLPATIMQIPMYVIWNKLGFINTYIPLTLGSFFGTAFNVFLMRQCFKGIPSQLYEAAIIDGANPPLIFWKIYMPLARPMIATIVVNTFIGSWNNLFSPLIYITNQNKYTITIGLRFLQSAYKGSEHLLMAASLIAITPTIIIYILAQKQFIGGMTSAAIKG